MNIFFVLIYRQEKDWAIFALKDDLFITGQNPSSSEAVAELLLKNLRS